MSYFILCILLSGCKRPLVLNVANPSRETTPLLRPPHSDLGGGLKRGVPLYMHFVWIKHGYMEKKIYIVSVLWQSGGLSLPQPIKFELP